MGAIGRLVAAAMLALAAPAAAQAIYRCEAAGGGTLYQDAPCTDGARVDVLPTRTDPAAVERLRRDLAAFEQRQALRDAERAREDDANERRRREARLDAALAQRPAAEPVYVPGYGPFYGDVRLMRPRPHRPPTPPLRPVERPAVPARPAPLPVSR